MTCKVLLLTRSGLPDLSQGPGKDFPGKEMIKLIPEAPEGCRQRHSRGASRKRSNIRKVLEGGEERAGEERKTPITEGLVSPMKSSGAALQTTVEGFEARN